MQINWKRVLQSLIAALLVCSLAVQGDIVTVQATSTTPSVKYSVYMQNQGWLKTVKNGKTGGTVGQALQMEGVKIKISGASGGITYRTYVQSKGWTSWKSNNQISGTVGKDLRMEAIQIKLTGKIASGYSVYYRLYCDGYGWLDWACNGASAGTTGGEKRVEGMQIKLVKKGESLSKGGAAFYDLTTYTTTMVQILSDGQTVDTFNGVSAKYITGTGNSNTGTYCCARYVTNYYKSIYGITVSNMFTGRTPLASSGYFYKTTSPKAGDIGYQLNTSGTSGHWFIIKAVNSDGTYTVIEQNWKWASGTATYCYINRKVSYASTKGFKVFRWSGRTDE